MRVTLPLCHMFLHLPTQPAYCYLMMDVHFRRKVVLCLCTLHLVALNPLSSLQGLQYCLDILIVYSHTWKESQIMQFYRKRKYFLVLIPKKNILRAQGGVFSVLFFSFLFFFFHSWNIFWLLNHILRQMFFIHLTDNFLWHTQRHKQRHTPTALSLIVLMC